MIEQLNQQYNDFHEIVYKRERAILWNIYFACALKDHETGLTRQEYKRFLARLNPKTREEFKAQGGFDYMDKNEDGKVDLDEFQIMLETILESLTVDEMKSQNNLSKKNQSRSSSQSIKI